MKRLNIPLLILVFSGPAAVLPAQGEWTGSPALIMRYEEHEFLAACREGHVPAVEHYLSDENFNPNLTFTCGATKTPATGLFLAARDGHLNVVKTLIASAKIDLNLDHAGDIALFIASQNGHDQIVKALIHTQKVNVNVRFSNGATPLLIASQNGHPDTVENLVRAGANPILAWQDSLYSNTPYDMAYQSRLSPIIWLFKPQKYAAYSRIMTFLEQEERQWRITRNVSINPVGYSNNYHSATSSTVSSVPFPLRKSASIKPI